MVAVQRRVNIEYWISVDLCPYMPIIIVYFERQFQLVGSGVRVVYRSYMG